MTNYPHRPSIARQRAAARQAIANRNGRTPTDPAEIHALKERLARLAEKGGRWTVPELEPKPAEET